MRGIHYWWARSVGWYSRRVYRNVLSKGAGWSMAMKMTRRYTTLWQYCHALNKKRLVCYCNSNSAPRCRKTILRRRQVRRVVVVAAAAAAMIRNTIIVDFVVMNSRKSLDKRYLCRMGYVSCWLFLFVHLGFLLLSHRLCLPFVSPFSQFRNMQWWHAVLNLSDTIGVTQNYVSPRNFEASWRKTRSSRKLLAWKWLNELESRPRYQHLAAKARRMNETDDFAMKYDPEVFAFRKQQEEEEEKQKKKQRFAV